MDARREAPATRYGLKVDMNPAQRVSVIVACRNEVREIRSFLESLLQQITEGLEVEYLIADGMSDDGTREILAEYSRRDPRIRMLDNPGRFVSTGLNAAIFASTGDIVLRLDAHTDFAPDYILECVRTLNRTGHQNVGGPARTKASGRTARAIAAAYHSPFSTGGAKFHDPDYEGFVDTVTYGCWRRETLDRIGLFDETLVRNQDDELNLRLIRSGGKIWQSPKIVSYYKPRGNPRSLFRQYYQYGFWKVAVIRKHRIPASWRHLIPSAFFAALGGLVVTAIVAAIAGARSLSIGALLALVVVLVAYLLCSEIFSWRAARKAGFDLLPLLPLMFLVFHVSYGLGFLTGILYSVRVKHAAQPDRRFAELSR
jgi:glycosyltransferase involved in cell wall biosynthesis